MNDERLLKSEAVKALALQLGADVVGIARALPVKQTHRYLKWLDDGCAGDMTYLSKYAEQRFDPGLLLPGARSVIVTGFNYYPSPADIESMKMPYKVARYAWGLDYHDVLRRILRRLRAALKKNVPDLKARICVDTAPFMDKYWAQEAGLGWQGKHSNLVSKDFGNWLVIGSLVIDAEVDTYEKIHNDHCGKCTACIDACPTGAIERLYTVNATKCISYWTIEAKSDHIPDDISADMQDWVFGCDICISVCPFNRFQKPHKEGTFSRIGNIGLVETGKVMELSESQFNEKFKSSPIYRPGLAGLRRNLTAISRFRSGRQ
ncbi:MAG: tRNA epoxyqueuosine(34) reductase QueG [candidate division Zixibacteria bacterium HGW-Zixibacteria-1]|nr:MAG: tRNA epoxyqueuosine(34) reductase QueG [candidate division Zixibacteria bacterium HGW-Zixibacteria-1]